VHYVELLNWEFKSWKERYTFIQGIIFEKQKKSRVESCELSVREEGISKIISILWELEKNHSASAIIALEVKRKRNVNLYAYFNKNQCLKSERQRRRMQIIERQKSQRGTRRISQEKHVDGITIWGSLTAILGIRRESQTSWTNIRYCNSQIKVKLLKIIYWAFKEINIYLIVNRI